MQANSSFRVDSGRSTGQIYQAILAPHAILRQLVSRPRGFDRLHPGTLVEETASQARAILGQHL